MNRRELLKKTTLASAGFAIPKWAQSLPHRTGNPAIVLSTWYNQSIKANTAAWNIIAMNGAALDAVELGVMQSENDWENCCVGLGGNPDRDGYVALDACIMNEKSQCGAVGFLERIKNPISVARAVMEKSPHVMLVGEGAQKFALQNGFYLQDKKLSSHAQKAYDAWLQKSEYKPQINIERNEHGPSMPNYEQAAPWNHDTIGMIAMDKRGNLSGACTTSGMGFKMRGRLGDSPIIGAGLYVDNEIGAATATGHGEEVIRISGSFLVVEYMRQGYSPRIACKKAVERIMEKTPRKLDEIQVGFIAINKNGDYGGYAINKGFDYGVKSYDIDNEKIDTEYIVQ